MYCSSCGTEVSAQDRHCPVCGIALSEQGTTSEDPPDVQPAETTDTGVAGNSAQQQGQVETTAGQPTQDQAGNTGDYSQPTQDQAGNTAGQRQPTQGQQRQPRESEKQYPSGGENTSLLSNLPIVGGLIYGVFSYVISFVVVSVFVLLQTESENGLGVLPAGESSDALLNLFGWFFYSAHGVPIGNSVNSESVNFVEESFTVVVDPTVPKLAFYVVPAFLLFAFGYVLASHATIEEPVTAVDGAKAGGTLAVGYLALTVAGSTTIFSYSAASATVAPNLTNAIVIMGLLYPAVFGGLGGYLSGR